MPFRTLIAKDPSARVAVEAMGGHGKVFVVGEITSKAKVDVVPIIKRIAGDIECEVCIVKQSAQIALGVDSGGVQLLASLTDTTIEIRELAEKFTGKKLVIDGNIYTKGRKTSRL